MSKVRSRNMQRLNELIEGIRRLSPEDRRRLFRHAKLVGLMEIEDLLTDRHALRIAPAVSPGRPALPNVSEDAPKPARPSASTSGGRVELKTPQPGTEKGDGNYRSAVSGRVVVGAPNQDADDSPLAMRPLPGQAPEQPIRIIFDGGSKGNPGQGYGSYALDWPAYPRQVVRLQFGNHVTNNEAEYDTLIAALEAVNKRLAENGADPSSARLEIWGDSQLVINQVKGEWQTNKPELRVRRDKARGLLNRYGAAQLRYHDRSNNVEVLGH